MTRAIYILRDGAKASIFDHPMIPWEKFGNRRAISHDAIENETWLTALIKSFPDRFEYAIHGDCWLFVEWEGDSAWV